MPIPTGNAWKDADAEEPAFFNALIWRVNWIYRVLVNDELPTLYAPVAKDDDAEYYNRPRDLQWRIGQWADSGSFVQTHAHEPCTYNGVSYVAGDEFADDAFDEETIFPFWTMTKLRQSFGFVKTWPAVAGANRPANWEDDSDPAFSDAMVADLHIRGAWVPRRIQEYMSRLTTLERPVATSSLIKEFVDEVGYAQRRRQGDTGHGFYTWAAATAMATSLWSDGLVESYSSGGNLPAAYTYGQCWPDPDYRVQLYRRTTRLVCNVRAAFLDAGLSAQVRFFGKPSPYSGDEFWGDGYFDGFNGKWKLLGATATPADSYAPQYTGDSEYLSGWTGNTDLDTQPDFVPEPELNETIVRGYYCQGKCLVRWTFE